MSASERARRSRALKGRERSPEHCAAIKASASSPAGRAQRSAQVKKWLADPANMAARVTQLASRWNRPGERERASEHSKKHTAARKAGRLTASADPAWRAEYSQLMREVMTTPETRAKSSAAHKKWWASLPEEYKSAHVSRLVNWTANNQRAGTRIEIAVKQALVDSGVEFAHQYVVDRAILDFYIPSLKLNIECDGNYWHSLPGAKQRDRRRDSWLRSQGIRVVRLTETAIKANCVSAVTAALARHTRERLD